MELTENEEFMVRAFRNGWKKLLDVEKAHDLKPGVWMKQFMDHSRGHKSLQVGVKDKTGRLSDDFVTLDLFDTSPVIDHNYDVMDMPFEDNIFRCIHCQSVLEHIPDPTRAIAEMHRVLEPGGYIWVQLPWQLQYHAHPKDYWRVSPEGLRVWLKKFREIKCGPVSFRRTGLNISVFFFGEKSS